MGITRDIGDGIGRYGGVFALGNSGWEIVGRVTFTGETVPLSKEYFDPLSEHLTAIIAGTKEIVPLNPTFVPNLHTEPVFLGFAGWFRRETLGTSNLRLPNEKEDRDKILELMNMLTRYTLTEKQTGNVLTRKENRHWIVAYTSVTGTDRDIGTELIRDLLNSRHVVRIHLNFPDDEGGFEPSSIFNTESRINASTPGVGSSTNVNINNLDSHYTIVADLDENWNWDWNWTGIESRIEEMPAHIILGHELIHALRVSLGDYMRTDNPENDRYYSFRSPHPIRVVGNRRSSLEEILTIGLAHRQQLNETSIIPGVWRITENALRREHKDTQGEPLPIRISHIGGETHAKVYEEIREALRN